MEPYRGRNRDKCKAIAPATVSENNRIVAYRKLMKAVNRDPKKVTDEKPIVGKEINMSELLKEHNDKYKLQLEAVKIFHINGAAGGRRWQPSRFSGSRSLCRRCGIGRTSLIGDVMEDESIGSDKPRLISKASRACRY